LLPPTAETDNAGKKQGDIGKNRSTKQYQSGSR